MKPKEGQEISKSAAKNKKKREAKARAKQEQEVATQEVVCPTSTFHNCYKHWPFEVVTFPFFTSLWIFTCILIMYSCSIRQLVNLLTLLLVYLSVHLLIYMSSLCSLRSKPVCLSVCLFVHLPVCLSACLFVCLHLMTSLSVHLFVSPSASLSVCLSACLSIFLFVCLSASFSLSFCLSLCLLVCLSLLSICLSACLFVCLPLCLSTSLSVCPSSCPSFDPYIHMPARFLVWVARHTIIIWGHNIYKCSTTSSLDINVSGSEVKASSPLTSITTSGWCNSSTRERKEAKKFEKGKISLYPTANTRKHTKSLKCVLCWQ